jgi:hypothetical protein
MIRAGKIYSWILKPDDDPSWTTADWSRAATLETRFSHLGVHEEDRRKLIPCAVWKAKFPGLLYTTSIENKLKSLMP